MVSYNAKFCSFEPSSSHTQAAYCVLTSLWKSEGSGWVIISTRSKGANDWVHDVRDVEAFRHDREFAETTKLLARDHRWWASRYKSVQAPTMRAALDVELFDHQDRVSIVKAIQRHELELLMLDETSAGELRGTPCGDLYGVW